MCTIVCGLARGTCSDCAVSVLAIRSTTESENSGTIPAGQLQRRDLLTAAKEGYVFDASEDGRMGESDILVVIVIRRNAMERRQKRRQKRVRSL